MSHAQKGTSVLIKWRYDVTYLPFLAVAVGGLYLPDDLDHG